MTMIYDVGNPSHSLGQTQHCGGVKLVNHRIPTLRSSQLDLQ